jgi:hypothetical protein
MVSSIEIVHDGATLVEGHIVHIFVRSDNFAEKVSIPEHVRHVLQRYCVEDRDARAANAIPG